MVTNEESISILLVDDDDTLRGVLGRELGRMGFAVKVASSGENALQIAGQTALDVVLLDIKMPGMGGLKTLSTFRENHEHVEIVILTGHGTMDNAILALKMGAFDYLTKPCKLDELETVLIRANEKKQLLNENLVLSKALARVEGESRLTGESPAAHAVLKIISKVAPTESTVLILGESGVGKELVARAIHRQSLRSKGPFVVVDCGVLHDSMLQSELFGHEKGAFTGAETSKRGLFEVANKGTILLDEIGEITPAMQLKLLRVLETGIFKKLGGVREHRVDVRVLASTNTDIDALVVSGKFREDLYFRLNVISLTVPPLRERREDIPLLARRFMNSNVIPGAKNKNIPPEAMEKLCSYRWPGNIRELRNVIERAIILSEGPEILIDDLPKNISADLNPPETDRGQYLPTLDEMECRYVKELLGRFNGRRAKVASVLGISERNLYRKLKLYNLTRS